MKVNEIFLSVQGESLSAGFPTIFVRFSGCNLRCNYCDTTYAYDDGIEMSPADIFEEVSMHYYKRICLTGGEPLLQKEINELLSLLSDYTVTIETNGSVELNTIKMFEKHSNVMDMKTPSSGCSEQMAFTNFDCLTEKDEIKFVIANRDDYEWTKNIIKSYYKKGTMTISPVYGKLSYSDIVNWILEDKLDVRFQLQLHKLIWKPNRRGV